jgi:3-methyladenine DNA glycosylase AlkC
MTECFRATLPGDFRKALRILEKLAPRITSGFVTLVLPDFVACYGLEDFDASMEALEYFTSFGSSEFAIRHFLRRDLQRTLGVMEKWSRDKSEHTRRLASEGCRPRLPWSFRLDALIADPTPVVPILENLNADPSLYVRKSVANHLNDITKDHPAWVMDRLESWPLDEPHTRWIAKRALRTLIKAGDRRALHIMGAGGKAEVRTPKFAVAPREVTLGGQITLSANIESVSRQSQRLVIDYVVHYVKKSGGTSLKVFKWKETVLGPGAVLSLSRSQSIRNFTTRVHYPGRHRVELMINGDRMAESSFVLSSANAK